MPVYQKRELLLVVDIHDPFQRSLNSCVVVIAICFTETAAPSAHALWDESLSKAAAAAVASGTLPASDEALHGRAGRERDHKVQDRLAQNSVMHDDRALVTPGSMAYAAAITVTFQDSFPETAKVFLILPFSV